MDIDDAKTKSLMRKGEVLHSLSVGSLSSSISRVSYSSRAIPSEKDFHFFYNFDVFKSPIKEIAKKSQLMLERIGTSTHILGKNLVFPEDLDDAHDWLVNMNDELFERFDASADEFQSVRKSEGEAARMPMPLDDGFQLVCGKKKKGLGKKKADDSTSDTAVKVASIDKKVWGAKPKVPFHIPSIPRPQDVFNILINNSNEPFQHVWLQRNEDDTRFVHPLEKISFLDFVDKDTKNIKPVFPSSIEHTPFKLVEDVNDLKMLAAKLRAVDAFAVDLEHNQYRSFQGLTCLMQISTRSEDFVVDTLKLRIHVGPHLREVFKDPFKKKVLHGADKDILWLQRDFGIYLCNLFDTGQAARVLNSERNTLKYLLEHYCGVTADKEYQNADWRLRPLPHEMIKYAREDTHYLLHIYDLMRMKLLLSATDPENSDHLLVEVYKRSYDICMQLYEKELLTESSYLYTYGLQKANFDSRQLAVVAGLCEWRDFVARSEDESTGYILPNKTLLEIANEMPVSINKLRRLLKMKHPYVQRNLVAVFGIIRDSLQNASSFEDAVQHLKKMAAEQIKGDHIEEDHEALITETSASLETVHGVNGDDKTNGGDKVNGSTLSFASVQPKDESMEVDGFIAEMEHPPHSKHNAATVPLMKKPSRGFGALLGAPVPRRNSNLNSKYKEQLKLEEIKSSVNLPFYTFQGGNDDNNPQQPMAPESPKAPEQVLESSLPSDYPQNPMPTDGVILLEDSSTDNETPENRIPKVIDEDMAFQSVIRMGDGDMGSQSVIKMENDEVGWECVIKMDGDELCVKGFDYEAAMEGFRFGEEGEVRKGKKNKKALRVEDGGNKREVGKRRQAFPVTGNRSATFI